MPSPMEKTKFKNKCSFFKVAGCPITKVFLVLFCSEETSCEERLSGKNCSKHRVPRTYVWYSPKMEKHQTLNTGNVACLNFKVSFPKIFLFYLRVISCFKVGDKRRIQYPCSPSNLNQKQYILLKIGP